MKGAGLRAPVDELDDRPLPLDDHVRDLDFSIGEGVSPAAIVLLVGLGATQDLASRDILEMAVLGDYSGTSIGVPQVP